VPDKVTVSMSGSMSLVRYVTSIEKMQIVHILVWKPERKKPNKNGRIILKWTLKK
jgi:hypothetical protein